MRHWGFQDARVTTGGADGGIDVESARALAQVKFEAAQVGRPSLQRLVGARGRNHHKQLLFFSGAGYGDLAVAYADEMEVALFRYDLTGAVSPVNRWASDVTRASDLSPGFAGVQAPTAPTSAGTARPAAGPGCLVALLLMSVVSALVQGLVPSALLFLAIAVFLIWRHRNKGPAALSRKRLNPAVPDPRKFPEVERALAAGDRLEAIRRYRAATEPRVSFTDAVAQIDACLAR